MKSKPNPYLGDDFDDFLRAEGIYEEVNALAMKRVIALVLARQMKRRRVTVSRLAKAMGTSRAAVNRIFDEKNTSITLITISRAAAFLGCKVNLEIVAN